MTTRHINIVEALTGEFTQIPPDSKLASPTSINPIARAHYALIRELTRMRVPSLSINTEPEEFEDVADYIERVAALFDVTWLQAVGSDVKANALCSIDMEMFSNQFVGAVSGNATYELSCAAESAREAQDVEAFSDYEYERDRMGHEG